MAGECGGKKAGGPDVIYEILVWRCSTKHPSHIPSVGAVASIGKVKINLLSCRVSDQVVSRANRLDAGAALRIPGDSGFACIGAVGFEFSL